MLRAPFSAACLAVRRDGFIWLRFGQALAVLTLWLVLPHHAHAIVIFPWEYPAQPTFANGAQKVLYFVNPAIPVTGPHEGVIRVPPGQKRLDVQILSSPPCGGTLYMTRNRQLRIYYDNRVDTMLSQYDYGPSSLLSVDRPPAGDYYFAPWRPPPWNGSCGEGYTVKAEYFPFPPAILAITPIEQTKDLGAAASIQVIVSSISEKPVNEYRWEKRPVGGSPTLISVAPNQNPSAIGFPLIINSLTEADDAEYRAILINKGGRSTSAWARVVVRLPPKITVQPLPRKVMPGGSVTFNVTATGTAPLTYRWERQEPGGNVVSIANGTGPSLTLNGVNYAAHAGSYRVVVMNAVNVAGVASLWAPLTIGPGNLGLSPANPSVDEGNPLSMTATALGTGPLTFKWYRGGQLRSSAVSQGFSDTLSISSALETDDGSWRLDVTNAAGTASLNFTLDVIPPPSPPTFLISPASADLTEGETLHLESFARGTRPISYQWFHTNDPLPGATSRTLIISNVGPEHAGDWFVRANNSLGQQDSSNATVTVSPGPKIVRQPANTEVAPSNSVTLSVEAIGRPPLGYHWFKNGQPLDEHGPGLTISNATVLDSGFYHVVVTNGLGMTIASLPARVTVKEGVALLGSVLWKHEWPVETPSTDPQDGVFITDFGDVLVKQFTNVFMFDAGGSLLWTQARAQQVMAAPEGMALLLSDGMAANGGPAVEGYRLKMFNRSGQLVWEALPVNLNSIHYGVPYLLTVTYRESYFAHLAMGGSGELLLINVHYSKYLHSSPYDFPEASRLSIDRLAIGSAPQAVEVHTLGLDYYEQDDFAPGRVSAQDLSLATGRDGSILFREAYDVLIGTGPYLRSAGYLAKLTATNSSFLFKDWQNGERSAFVTLGPLGQVLVSADRYPIPPYKHESLLIGSDGRLNWRRTGRPDRQLWGKSALYSSEGVHDPASGVRLTTWNFPRGFSWNWPPVLGDDGSICFGGSLSNRATLVALSMGGDLVWQFTAPQARSGLVPSIGADGTVYFPTERALYALKGSAPIMDSSWPIDAGNVRGTYRAQELPTVPALPSQAVSRGGTLTLNGASAGPQPIRYQWMKDGQRIAGATNAGLAVPDLRGFDSGEYRVRVSNPTGDKLSQPAAVKVSFDPAPFVNVAHSLEAAFTNAPPSANTRRDEWQFFHSINETNRNGRYPRMESFIDVGLRAWTPGGLLDRESAGINPTAAPVDISGGTIPPGRVFLNPGMAAWSNCVGLARVVEISGYYSVTGRLSRLATDTDGDGVRWHLDAGTLNVLSGALANTATATNIGIAGIYLRRGEPLHLILSPGESRVADWTGVELEIRLAQPDPNSEPGFLQSPQSLSVLAGQSAAFNVQVDGMPEPFLQWQRSTNNGATWDLLLDGDEFAGVSTTNLILFGTTLEHSSHLFRVEALNVAGAAVSGAARLTVTEGPVSPAFVQQPQTTFVITGSLMILTAEASGTGPLSYQWYHNDMALAGATGATFTLASASPADTGWYYVVVQNALGRQTSAVASVTVSLPPPPPTLGAAVTNGTVFVKLRGQPGSQWKLGRSPWPHGPWHPVAQMTVPPLPPGDFIPAGELVGETIAADMDPFPDTAFYLAELDVPVTRPQISAQPLNTVMTEGGEGVLSLFAEGAGLLSYQWWKDGAPLDAATNQTLLIPGVTTNRAGNYFVVVSNAYGAVTSQVAMVSVTPPPVVVKVENIFPSATSELSNGHASNAVNGITVGDFWASDGLDPAPVITFDLQGRYRLDSLLFWNYSLGPAIKRMRVEYSVDGADFELFGELALAIGANTQEPSDSYTLNRIEARWIRFVILENHSGQQFPFVGSPTQSPFVAIQEVDFYGEFVAAAPPEIVHQPESQTNILANLTVSLNASANGTLPVTYQWWHGGNLIPGATNALLTIGPLAAGDSGVYSLVVSNVAGEIVSQPALITVVTNEPLLSAMPANLLAYYPLNNSTEDLSGNGRHAQTVPGTISVTRDRFGILGGALVATNVMIVSGLDPDDYSGNFSFGCWFRIDNGSVNYLMYWDVAPYLAFSHGGISWRMVSEHGGGVLNLVPGQWYHALVTHGAEYERLYVNGVNVSEWPTSALQNHSSTMYLGISGGYGALDDVTVFSRELSPEEVQSLAAPP